MEQLQQVTLAMHEYFKQWLQHEWLQHMVRRHGIRVCPEPQASYTK